MANTDVTQRNLYDRAELAVPHTGVGVRRRSLLVAYTVLATLLLAVLGFAAIEGIDEWSQLVVLGAIVTTTVGAMIALSPRRRG